MLVGIFHFPLPHHFAFRQTLSKGSLDGVRSRPFGREFLCFSPEGSAGRDDKPPFQRRKPRFSYPLAVRPLQRSRYGRCTQKAMRKESAAATHRHTLSLAPNSITLLRAQRLSHQGVASQHEKPNEGAGFFFLSLYFEGLFCTLSESLSGTSRPLMAFEETR